MAMSMDEARDCDPSGQGCKKCAQYLDSCDGKEGTEEEE